MKNLFKSKKFNSFLLTMIMCLSLFLFSACGDIDDGDEGGGAGGGTSSSKVVYKLIYRPYATTIPSGSDKSYGEIIEQNILDLSSDVLSRIVGEYGIGEVSVKDGESTKLVSPKTDGVDYEGLLGLSTTLSDIEKIDYAQDFSKITNIYYSSQNNKVLVLSNYSVSISSLLEYDTDTSAYIAKSDLKDLNTGSTIPADEELLIQTSYKFSDGGDIAYVFIGETIGSNSINGTDNVKTFVSKFFKSNFGSIQKSLTGNITIVDGSDTDLPFSAWNWSLTDAEFASCTTAEEYKLKYIEKFQLNMGVEIAKTILTRYEGLTLTEELDSLYQQASVVSAGDSQKEKFISDCCDYIDHLGLTEEEKTLLTKYLTETAIGSTIAVSGTNYEENCANVLLDTMSNYALNPILEIKTFEGTLETDEIDGYLQSIVMIAEKEREPESFVMSIGLKEENEDMGFMPLIRYSDAEASVVQATPFEVDAEDLEYGVICGDFGDVAEDTEILLKPTTDNLTDGSVMANGISQYFINTKVSENGRGVGWCYNDTSICYLEIAFPTSDFFPQNQIISIEFGI